MSDVPASKASEKRRLTLGVFIGQITSHAHDRMMWRKAYQAAQDRGVDLRLIEDWRLEKSLNGWLYRMVTPHMVDGVLLPLNRVNTRGQYRNSDILKVLDGVPVVTLDLTEYDRADFVSDPTQAIHAMVSDLVTRHQRRKPCVLLQRDHRDMHLQQWKTIREAYQVHGIQLAKDQVCYLPELNSDSTRMAFIKQNYVESKLASDSLLCWSQVDFEVRFRDLFSRAGVLIPEDISVACLLDNIGRVEHDPLPSYISHNVYDMIPEAMDELIHRIDHPQASNYKTAVRHPAQYIERGTTDPETQLAQLHHASATSKWRLPDSQLQDLSQSILDEFAMLSDLPLSPSRVGLDQWLKHSMRCLMRNDALGFARACTAYFSWFTVKSEALWIRALGTMDQVLAQHLSPETYPPVHSLLECWREHLRKILACKADYMMRNEFYSNNGLRNQVLKVKFSDSDTDYARVVKMLTKLWVEQWMCMVCVPDDPDRVYPLVVAADGKMICLNDRSKTFQANEVPPWASFGLTPPSATAIRSFDLGDYEHLDRVKGYICCSINPLMQEGLMQINRLLSALHVMVEQHRFVLDQQSELQRLNDRLHQEVEQRKKIEQELEFLAMHDSLTGLANRMLFREHLQIAMNQFRRGKHQFALIYIDLDQFKPINDTYGHKVGDQVLKKFAQVLTASVRGTDTVARLGGDEFAIVVRDAQEVQAIIDRIQLVISKPLNCGQLLLKIEASFGYVLGMRSEQSIEELMHYADERMYEMKMRKRQ